MAQGHKRALVIVKNSEIFYVEEKTSALVKLINQPYLEDLETIDTEILNKSLSLWKEKNKGIRLRVLVIFSDEVLFEKTFKNDDPEIEEKIVQYQDKVPFDRPISRHYDRKTETDFVVISRTLLESIIESFESQGFEVINTVPEKLVKSVIKFDDFDIETSKKILNKFESFKNPQLALNNKSIFRIKKQYQAEAKSKSTLIILAGVLTALIATFLLILFMQSYFNNKIINETQNINGQINLSIPVDQNETIKQNLNIEISFSQDASKSATLLKNNLESENYKNIILKISNIFSPNPTMIFPKGLPEELQNDILIKVQEVTESLLIKHDEKVENFVKISL